MTEVGHAEHLDVLEDIAHHGGVAHGYTVVRKADCSCCDQLAHRTEFLASAANGCCSDGQDFGIIRFVGGSLDVFDDGDAICCRAGIGHAGYHGKSTGGRCPGASCDGLFVFFAGFTQVHVEVNESGADDFVCGIDDGRARSGPHACICREQTLVASNNHTVVDEQAPSSLWRVSGSKMRPLVIKIGMKESSL